MCFPILEQIWFRKLHFDMNEVKAIFPSETEGSNFSLLKDEIKRACAREQV